MLVRYRMSVRVVAIDPQRSLADARELLAKNRIRQLPVVRGKRLVGIVTDRDLRGAGAKAALVKQVMTPKPFTIAPDATVDEAARILRARKINALPVVDKGKLAGILTASDVLAAFVDLTGVAEPTYRLTVEVSEGKRAHAELRRTVEHARGEVKWMRPDRQRPSLMHLRLKARNFDDVVTALEGAGFEVTSVVAPSRQQV
jgi:acetoin utilization protein AcuB